MCVFCGPRLHDIPIGELVAQSLDYQRMSITMQMLWQLPRNYLAKRASYGFQCRCAWRNHRLCALYRWQLYRGPIVVLVKLDICWPRRTSAMPLRQAGMSRYVAASVAILAAAREANLPVNDLKDLEALATKGNSQAIAIYGKQGRHLDLRWPVSSR